MNKETKKERRKIFDSKMDSLLSIIADFYAMEKQEIIEGGNRREYVEPRQVFFLLARDEMSIPIVKIGRFVNKHHATVLHGIDVVSNEMGYNRPLRTRVNIIRDEYRDLMANEIKDFEERKEIARKALDELFVLFQSNDYIASGSTFERGINLMNQLKKTI